MAGTIRVAAVGDVHLGAESAGSLRPVLTALPEHADVLQDAIAGLLGDHGITVLEGDAATVPVRGHTLGIAGTKGFGGGFAGRCASAFGERLMREFASHTIDLADSLRAALAGLESDVTVALTHYAPIEGTLHGEPREIYPFLGSYLLGEAIDLCGAELAVHGHAHAGTERGTTPGGVRVRNVAQPVIHSAFAVYDLPVRVRSRSA